MGERGVRSTRRSEGQGCGGPERSRPLKPPANGERSDYSGGCSLPQGFLSGACQRGRKSTGPGVLVTGYWLLVTGYWLLVTATDIRLCARGRRHPSDRDNSAASKNFPNTEYNIGSGCFATTRMPMPLADGLLPRMLVAVSLRHPLRQCHLIRRRDAKQATQPVGRKESGPGFLARFAGPPGDGSPSRAGDARCQRLALLSSTRVIGAQRIESGIESEEKA
jgi:hypothetical protein